MSRSFNSTCVVSVFLFVAPGISAQETTEEGYLLSWDKSITVVPITIAR